MSRGQATKFIKVSDEFSNDSPVNHLGTNALYMITSLNEPEQAKGYSASNDEPIII